MPQGEQRGRLCGGQWKAAASESGTSGKREGEEWLSLCQSPARAALSDTGSAARWLRDAVLGWLARAALPQGLH